MPKYSLFLFLFFYSILIIGQSKDSLLARYSFNGNTKDELGNHDAKAYGAKLVEDRFGNENSAYYLQGNADSYINLGNSSDLKPKRGTISLWVKINQPIWKGTGIESNIIIITKAHTLDDFNEAFCIAYHLELKNININTSCSDTNVVTLYPTKPTSLREWHHVVMTYDNQFLSFYLDGILENKAAKKFESQFLEGDSILVGKVTSKKNNRYLNACVDDIEIYGRVLTPNEVDKLYHAPNPNKNFIFVKWILISLALLLATLVVIWLIKRRIFKLVNIEKEKNQVRNNWYEQENRVLVAQMDPHFIFNSLNTIQQFIIINDNDKAQLYLTKFSRLLRMILESNIKDSICLQDEIEIVKQYLEIESLRFNNVFKYQITIEEKIKPENLYIPRFLVQPFVENALWHGLLPKDGDKQLQISFAAMDEKTLACTIEDNGIGREAASAKEPHPKNKPLAVNFIRQRLQLMSKIYKVNYEVTIIDKAGASGESAGTKVVVTIPILK